MPQIPQRMPQDIKAKIPHCETGRNIAHIVSQHDQGHSMYKSFTSIQFHTEKAKALIEKTTFFNEGILTIHSIPHWYFSFLTVITLLSKHYGQKYTPLLTTKLLYCAQQLYLIYNSSCSRYSPVTVATLQMVPTEKKEETCLPLQPCNTNRTPLLCIQCTKKWGEFNSMQTKPLVKTLS